VNRRIRLEDAEDALRRFYPEVRHQKVGGRVDHQIAASPHRVDVQGDSAVDAESGFADPIVLSKPFDFEGLKAVLGKLLGAPIIVAGESP